MANGSLANATWHKYHSCWKMIRKILEDKGLELSFPLKQDMLWMIIACLVEKGLKATTIEGYIASLKQAHIVRGLGGDINLACHLLDVLRKFQAHRGGGGGDPVFRWKNGRSLNTRD